MLIICIILAVYCIIRERRKFQIDILIACVFYNSDKSRGSGTLITLGAVTIGTLGILTYAKKDPEVRATLEGWIPGTDKAIRIIFLEDSSYFDFVLSFFETLKQT